MRPVVDQLRRHLTPLLLVLALLAGVAGCKSECHQLCVRQAECNREAGVEVGELGHDSSLQLCKTTCESMAKDPKRSEAMKAVKQCAASACDAFTECVKKAGGGS